MEQALTLTEKLLLLAVKPDKGGIFNNDSQSIDFTLTGAAWLELVLSKNAGIINKRIELISDKAGLPLHAFMLEKLVRSPRPRKLSHWLSSFIIPKRKVRALVYDSLILKKEIRLEDRHFLFFRWKKPFLAPGNHAVQLINQIKSHIIDGPGSPEELYLISLLEPARLLRRIYPDRQMRSKARQKIRGYLSGNQITGEVRQAIETASAVRTAVNAAIAAAHAARS